MSYNYTKEITTMQGLRIFITQLFLLLFLNIGLFAQLIISPTNAVQAVQDVLVGGGVQISNMQFSGNIQALGKFTTGASNTNLGFSNGLILSSGKASQAAGLVSSFASTNNYSNSDPQLASLVSGSINDAAVLSFNFIPESDTITFRYVFASEEYPNYANSTYNDVFGFFLSGPNPNGGNYVFQNIAKIPGTNTPVSINNINNGTSNYGPCMNCTYYVNNQSPSNPYIAYNGATVVLTATAYVIPCLEYSIKLAIGDVNDGIYDSGVFLEANSFTSPRITIEPNYETNIIENSAIEGCSDVQVVFTLPYQSSSDRWIEYYFFGSANIDDDYTIDPPNQQYFIIPAGADSAILTINPINDGIIEGTEEIMLVVQTSVCQTAWDTLFIQIYDNIPIEIEISNDTLLCEEANIDLWSIATQGVPPYNYEWSNGNTTQNQTVAVNQSETYYLSITDACDNLTMDSVIIVKDSVFLNVMNEATICEGDFITLTATASDSIAWLGLDFPNPSVSPEEETIYYVTTSNICGSLTDSVRIFVDYIPYFSLASDTAICERDNIEIGIDDMGYSYLWNTGQNVPNLTINYAGQYILTVTNGLCSHSDTININRAFCEYWVPNSFTPNNDNQNETFKPYGIAPHDYEMLIFDRWGKQVFRTTSFEKGWDGKINNQNAPYGLYFYSIFGKAFTDSQKTLIKQDALYLIR